MQYANGSSPEHSHSHEQPCQLKSSCINCIHKHPALDKRCTRCMYPLLVPTQMRLGKMPFGRRCPLKYCKSLFQYGLWRL